jgi:hypothetical protein
MLNGPPGPAFHLITTDIQNVSTGTTYCNCSVMLTI